MPCHPDKAGLRATRTGARVRHRLPDDHHPFKPPQMCMLTVHLPLWAQHMPRHLSAAAVLQGEGGEAFAKLDDGTSATAAAQALGEVGVFESPGHLSNPDLTSWIRIVVAARSWMTAAAPLLRAQALGDVWNLLCGEATTSIPPIWSLAVLEPESLCRHDCCQSSVKMHELGRTLG